MKLTAKKAAHLAGVSVSLIYAWCGNNILPHYRLGRGHKRGRILIEESDLVAFLCDQKIEGNSFHLDSYKLKHIV